MTGFAFTGEMRDANGLQYHRARYYHPSLAIFPSLDPYEGTMGRPMSLNRYLYVSGNPVMNTDPSGKTPLCFVPFVGWLSCTTAAVYFGAGAAAAGLSAWANPCTSPNYRRADCDALANAVQDVCLAPFDALNRVINPPGVADPDREYYPDVNPLRNPPIWTPVPTRAPSPPPKTPTPGLPFPSPYDLSNPNPSGTPAPTPGTKPQPQPTATAVPTPTRTTTPKVVVELGAGMYTNAIRNKGAHPGWQMYATNQHSEPLTELLEMLDNRGQIQGNLDAHKILRGFREAQRLGIIVGNKPSQPLANADIESNIADIVYVIAPWPGLLDQGVGIDYGFGMGHSAGRIAKSDSGTEIYISTDNPRTLEDFKQAVNGSGQNCIWQPDNVFRFGDSDYANLILAEVCTMP